MILNYSFTDAIKTAEAEATVTGRRQRVSRRIVIRGGLPWWVTEPAKSPRHDDDGLDLPPAVLTPGRHVGERIPLGEINLAAYGRP